MAAKNIFVSTLEKNVDWLRKQFSKTTKYSRFQARKDEPKQSIRPYISASSNTAKITGEATYQNKSRACVGAPEYAATTFTTVLQASILYWHRTRAHDMLTREDDVKDVVVVVSGYSSKIQRFTSRLIPAGLPFLS